MNTKTSIEFTKPNYYITISNSIYKYFIDDNIIIDDKSSVNIKIKLTILKYKKLIALVLLLILLVIVVIYNPFYFPYTNNINHTNTTKINSRIQNGGSGFEGLAGLAEKVVSTIKPADISALGTAASSAFGPEAQKALGTATSSALGGMGSLPPTNSSSSNTKNTVRNVIKKKLKAAGTKVYNAGASLANKFKDIAPYLYSILYAVALFVVMCILIVPSAAFLIVGLICYLLLKSKMKYIKSF